MLRVQPQTRSVLDGLEPEQLKAAAHPVDHSTSTVLLEIYYFFVR